MNKKILLVLQDIGVERQEFEKMIVDAGLSLEVIWEEKNVANKELVVGIITVKHRIGAELLNKFPNVKFVGCSFTGYDQVDLKFCKQNEIAVFNVPAYSTDSVAELALCLTISLLRQIPRVSKIAETGDWSTLTAGTELADKTIGIVGTGAIGLRVAELFKAFGCKLLAWSRTQKKEFEQLGGEYLNSLEELCSKVDVLTIHVALNEETKGLINNKHFQLMKPSAYLINVSRGPIVNEADLVKALNDEKIAGAGIDVFTVEPLPASSPLIKAKNILLTPHVAYKTKEALQRKAQITAAGVKAFMNGEKLNRIV